MDVEGTIGVGECVAFTSPWYTEETVDTAWNTLENWIIPAIVESDIFTSRPTRCRFSDNKRQSYGKSGC